MSHTPVRYNVLVGTAAALVDRGMDFDTGDLAYVQDLVADFKYDATSVAAENGTTVIGPALPPGPGRWLIVPASTGGTTVGTFSSYLSGTVTATLGGGSVILTTATVLTTQASSFVLLWSTVSGTTAAGTAKVKLSLTTNGGSTNYTFDQVGSVTTDGGNISILGSFLGPNPAGYVDVSIVVEVLAGADVTFNSADVRNAIIYGLNIGPLPPP